MADVGVNPEAIRASLFDQLLDWEGEEVARVYEPLSWHIGYIWTLVVVIFGAVFVFEVLRRYRASLSPFVPFSRVLNSELVIEQAISDESTKLRTCAVVGGNGFIGSHLVEELLQSKQYRVYVLGRRIPPEEKRLQDVAGYVQVDMEDYDNLVRAFADVDTVFHLGVAVPNAFVNSDEAVWSGNRGGAKAVVGACKVAGVKNLIYLGGHFGCGLSQQATKHLAFLHSKNAAEEVVLEANEDNGLKSCVICTPVIFGAKDHVTALFVCGKLPTFPSIKHTLTFMYVKDLVPLLRMVEEKLEAGDNRVAGRSVNVIGERMTFEEFFSLSAWRRKPPHFVSFRTVRFCAWLNTWCAFLFRVAPLGSSMCPQILDCINLPHKEKSVPFVAEILGLADDTPPSVEAGVKDLMAHASHTVK